MWRRIVPQLPRGEGKLRLLAAAAKRCCVLLLLRLGGVRVGDLWTQAQYEQALLAAGFTQVHVSDAARPCAATAPHLPHHSCFPDVPVSLHRSTGISRPV
jgi:hypothetical protein